MRSFFLLFLFLAAHGICSGQHNRQTRQLDSIFTMLCEQNQFNGSVLIAEKGKTVFTKGYGYRDERSKKPNTPGTVFELASCSKQFTAMAIVLLHQQGKLAYTDQLSQYIPELSFWNGVSIYNLLRHTSGIGSYTEDLYQGWDSNTIATNKDLIRFYAQRKDTLLFVPGSRHWYSNTNYALLASIIERVSGEDYATFLHKHIFAPLGMNHTFVYSRRLQPRHISNFAIGYVLATNSMNRVTPDDPEAGNKSVYFMDGIVGSAKVNSTVEDLLKWVNALKNNSLVTRQDFEQMTEVTQTSGGKNIPYGFGLDLAKGDNKFSFGHTGGWDGYLTLIHQNMIKDRTIIILQNFHQGATPFTNINEILDNQPLTAEFRRKTALPEQDIKQYTGTYIDEQHPEEQHLISYQDGHLVYNTSLTHWNMRFFPSSAQTFQALRQGGRNGVLEFTRLQDGSTELKMTENGSLIGTGIKKQR